MASQGLQVLPQGSHLCAWVGPADPSRWNRKEAPCRGSSAAGQADSKGVFQANQEVGSAPSSSPQEGPHLAPSPVREPNGPQLQVPQSGTQAFLPWSASPGQLLRKEKPAYASLGSLTAGLRACSPHSPATGAQGLRTSPGPTSAGEGTGTGAMGAQEQLGLCSGVGGAGSQGVLTLEVPDPRGDMWRPPLRREDRDPG